jgi:hypothetical protein
LTRVGTFPSTVSLHIGAHTFLGTFIVLGTFLKTYEQYINVKEENCNHPGNDRLITVLKVFHLQVTSTNMKDLNLLET